jgi:hypothetical protein
VKTTTNPRKTSRGTKARQRKPTVVSEGRTVCGPSGRGILGRILNYAEKMYGLCRGLREVKDGRIKPRVPAGRAALAYLMLLLTRLGSLNALEERQAPRAWVKWLGGPLPSADVMGDVAATMQLEPLRALLRHQHARAKRNKGFGRDPSGLRWLILDGHEGVASYRRSWTDCLERVVHCAKGDRTQSYFRYVGAYLTNGRQWLLIDAEAQLPGEGEIACAMRLLTRLFEQYPRAFDVVCGDNAYMDPKLWKLVREHKKHLIAVLKNEDRDLLVDARSLFAGMDPTPFDDKKVQRLCWDLKGFTSWPQCGEGVRVVRSVEQTTIRRQRTKQQETLETEWFWVTSLPPSLASTQTIVRAGHGRWDIENHGFNELGNLWHGDHAYKYNAHALLACTLLLFIAVNLFHAFIERNLKPQIRLAHTAKYWADLVAAEFQVLFNPYTAPS